MAAVTEVPAAAVVAVVVPEVAEVTEAVMVADVRTEVPDPAMDATAMASEATMASKAAVTAEVAATHPHSAAVGAAAHSAAVKAAAAEAAGRSIIRGNERRRTESKRRDGGEDEFTEHRNLLVLDVDRSPCISRGSSLARSFQGRRFSFRE